MDDAQAGLLGEFMSITGLDDTTQALSILEASNWVLEEAVNLFFATGGDIGAGAAGAAGGARADGGNGSSEALAAMEEDEVRAPLPVIKERLYGDVSGHHGIPAHPARWVSWVKTVTTVVTSGCKVAGYVQVCMHVSAYTALYL